MELAPTALGKRTTAEQALRGLSLRHKRAIVTGAASGLGKETARVLALAGADVVIAVRSKEAGQAVAKELKAGLPSHSGSIIARALDLSDFEQVRSFAGELLADGAPIHLLLNNAGIMATPWGLTRQGFEQQMGVNHLGHFLLTKLLLERLVASRSSRIVTVSSGAHYRGSGAGVVATLETDPRYQARRYSAFRAYSESKLANVLFARGLARRVPAEVLSLSLHPGVIFTSLMRHLGALPRAALQLAAPLLCKTVEQGAATSVFAATAPELDGHSGIFLSDCNERAPNPEALDDTLIEKVWALSERATATTRRDC